MKIDTLFNDADRASWILSSGDRRLIVGLDKRKRTASATVRINSVGTGHLKREGTTTRLHWRALAILKREAREIGNVTFQFNTTDPRMRDWALSSRKGRRVFPWDNVTLDDLRTHEFEATIVIKGSK